MLNISHLSVLRLGDGGASSSSQPTQSTCEERKLQHLRKIEHLLVEGRLLDDVTPEEEAEETPYSAHWEGYPEETFPLYEVPLCRHWYPSIILEKSYGDVPTAEELAERMQREEEKDEIYDEEAEKVNDVPGEDEDPKGMMDEGELEKGDESDDNVDDTDEEHYMQEEGEEEDIGEDQPYLACNYTDNEKTPNSAENKKAKETSVRRRQITFSNRRHVFHYPKGGAVGCRYKEALEDDTNDDDDDDHEDAMEKQQNEYDDLVVMEEDDPLVEAERLGFSTRFACDPEEQKVDLINFLLTYKPEAVIMSEQSGAAEAPRLRMRCKKQKEGKMT
ncbi:protein RIC-3 [Tachysurus ichikawai]